MRTSGSLRSSRFQSHKSYNTESLKLQINKQRGKEKYLDCSPLWNLITILEQQQLLMSCHKRKKKLLHSHVALPMTPYQIKSKLHPTHKQQPPLQAFWKPLHFTNSFFCTLKASWNSKQYWGVFCTSLRSRSYKPSALFRSYHSYILDA